MSHGMQTKMMNLNHFCSLGPRFSDSLLVLNIYAKKQQYTLTEMSHSFRNYFPHQ